MESTNSETHLESTVNQAAEAIETRSRGTSKAWAVAIAGVMFGLGSLFGSSVPASQAVAAQDDEVVFRNAQSPIQIYQMRPPALALPEGARALVGAADGRYYMVDCNGVAYRARFDGRSDLFWRDEIVEGTQIQIIGE